MELLSLAVIIAALSYLIGSLSFSIIITGYLTKKDIRESGSGNAGLTNVLRSVGKRAAIVTLLGDSLKVVAAVSLSRLLLSVFGFGELYELCGYFSGFFCVLGHLYPMYYGFKGGKGVLSTAVMVLMIRPERPWIFLTVIGIFAVVVAITKYVSLGSLCAAAALPFATFFLPFKSEAACACALTDPGTIFYLEHQRVILTLFSAVFSALVIIKHISNIKRLIRGDEKKLSFKKS